MMNQTRLKMVCALVCVLWLTLGGMVPAQAAAPMVGALSQAASQSAGQTVQPTRLLIPSLKIDAPIEAVGQDDNNVMAAPSTNDRVAWYNRGPRPGENGNAVVAGHYDDVKGKPAVFWDLDKFAAGDEIIVRFNDESEKRFEVMTVETYDTDEAPLERIFGVDFERDLNLITCDGQWNAQSKLYERRLVVYARLIRESNVSVVPEDSTVATTALAKAAAELNATASVTESVATVASDGVAEAGSDETVVATSAANGTNVEYADDPTQANTSSTFAVPSPPRTSHARQDRGQPFAAH